MLLLKTGENTKTIQTLKFLNEPYIAAFTKVPIFREGQKNLEDFSNSVLFSEDTNFRKENYGDYQASIEAPQEIQRAIWN